MTRSTTPGHALLWGRNQHGQLGLGNCYFNRTTVAEPTKINIGTTAWVQIACGYEHTVALSSNGEVFTWGKNVCKEHGHCYSVPTKLGSFSGETVVKVACGYRHSAAVTKSGKLFIW